MINKGDKFICIESVFMSDPNDLALPQLPAYKKGEIYTSDKDNCITDESGNTCHIWPDKDSLFARHFQRINEIDFDNINTYKKRREELEYAKEIITEHEGTLIVNSGDSTHHTSIVIDRQFIERLPELIDKRIEELSKLEKTVS